MYGVAIDLLRALALPCAIVYAAWRMAPDTAMRRSVRRAARIERRSVPARHYAATLAHGGRHTRAERERRAARAGVQNGGELFDAPPECAHGYSADCPDCDVPDYLPTVLP